MKVLILLILTFSTVLATTEPPTTLTPHNGTTATTQQTTEPTTTPTPPGKVDWWIWLLVAIVVAVLIAVACVFIYRGCKRRSYERWPKTSRPSVGVCTSATKGSVEAFFEELRLQLGDEAEVNFLQLPYNEVDKFRIETKQFDVIILCHTIHNRRLAITDVMDALYNNFLKNAASDLGKTNVAVIVHDFPADRINTRDKYNQEIEKFQILQPTTFRSAALVIITGKLDDSVEVPMRWDDITHFVTEAKVRRRGGVFWC